MSVSLGRKTLSHVSSVILLLFSAGMWIRCSSLEIFHDPYRKNSETSDKQIIDETLRFETKIRRASNTKGDVFRERVGFS